MAGRAQAFSDPRVIDLLTDQYIAVAENSSSLEREQTDKGEFFRHIAEQGHYGGRTFPTTTRQGSYTFTAQGQFLASVNTREAIGMEGMLRTGLDRWRAGYSLGGPSPVQLAPEAGANDGYPTGGLVLEVAARDLPRETDTRPEDWRKIAWNLDYAWITRDEARDLVPEPREIGARRDFPERIVRRLARFHLRDFVRGEPVAWLPEALQAGGLTATITAIDGGRISLTLSGAVHLENDTVWTRPEDGVERRYPTGYRCTLQGEAIWDESRGGFTLFDLVAVGDRWGANQYNNREDDLGPAPQGIAFTLAGDAPSDHTPPHCIRTWRRAREGARASRVVVTTEQYYQPD